VSGYDTAKAVLAKASLGDRTFSRPDAGVLAFWAEQLHDVDPAAALRAVTAHYSEEHRRIMPSDVLKRVRAESAAQRRQDYDQVNAVPDADPDDVPAYLAALRAGRLVDNSPAAQPRPISAVVEKILRRRPIDAQAVTE